MKRIKILKQGVVTNQAEGKNEDMGAWLASCLAKNKFGKPERWQREQEPDIASIDTREVETPLGTVTEYKYAAEFTVVEEDMTAEIAAREADEDGRKQAHEFLKKLKKSDLADIDACAAAIMKIVKHLRADK